MSTIKLAIVSDVHARESEAHGTYAVMQDPPLARNLEPVADLLALIERLGLRADYVIAPGDICDQADQAGLIAGWRRLHQIAELMHARLLAVPGNHDVVTRERTADPRGRLKLLLPSMPTGNTETDDIYWYKGWAVVEEADHRFLLLDSTHGFPPYPGTDDETSREFKEYLSALNRGVISERMREEIALALDGLPPKLNIAVLHHHPQEHQLRRYLKDDYGTLIGGDEFVDLLESRPSLGRWLIVHGHKHIPQLVSAATVSSNGPLILCAASLSAQLWNPISTITRNQFHMLNVSNDTRPRLGTVHGTIQSYTWGYGEGWEVSHQDGAGLPAVTGFGALDDFGAIGRELLRYMDANDLNVLDIEQVVQEMPMIPHLMPKEFQYLEDALAVSGVTILRDRQERVRQIIREQR